MPSGKNDFDTDTLGLDNIDGGIRSLVKEPYAKNMWLIMDRFHILPSDPNFQNLTDFQMSFILENMRRENEEANAANGLSGVDVTSDATGELDGSDWKEKDIKYDTPEEEAETARQLREMVEGTSYENALDNVEYSDEDRADDMAERANLAKIRQAALASIGLVSDDSESNYPNEEPEEDDKFLDL